MIFKTVVGNTYLETDNKGEKKERKGGGGKRNNEKIFFVNDIV